MYYNKLYVYSLSLSGNKEFPIEYFQNITDHRLLQEVKR